MLSISFVYYASDKLDISPHNQLQENIFFVFFCQAVYLSAFSNVKIMVPLLNSANPICMYR